MTPTVDTPVPLPLVSIIICCYNRASMLPRTLDSALAQEYPNTEIVLYDDGSTDETPQVAAAYAEKIRYIRRENNGIAIARTNACEMANGEFIAFLDDDDLMPPSRIADLYAALTRHPQAKFAVGEIALIDEQDNIVSTPSLAAEKSETVFADGFEAVLWPHVPATVHTTLFRRKDGEAIGWFDPHYDGAGEDKDFFARLAFGEPIVYVAKVVSLYRRGHDSLTRNGLNVLRAQLKLFESALSRDDITAAFRARMHSRLRFTLQRLWTFSAAEREALDFDARARRLPLNEKLALFWYQAKQAFKRAGWSGSAISL